jgi:hypothetical protein
MSKRNSTNTNSNRSTRKTARTNRTTRSSNTDRTVFDPTEYDNRIYRKERRLKTIGVGIRRGDTRHGDYSRVVVWRWATDDAPSQRFTMSLSEARSLKSFLDRELQVRAR